MEIFLKILRVAKFFLTVSVFLRQTSSAFISPGNWTFIVLQDVCKTYWFCVNQWKDFFLENCQRVECRWNCRCRMSDEVAQNSALTTKTLVECDKITVRIKKTLFLKRLKYSLRAKWDCVALQNALELCTPLEMCGPMLKAGTYIHIGVSTEY